MKSNIHSRGDYQDFVGIYLSSSQVKTLADPALSSREQIMVKNSEDGDEVDLDLAADARGKASAHAVWLDHVYLVEFAGTCTYWQLATHGI